MPNPFTLAFGKEPASIIRRDLQVDEIIEAFSSEGPGYQVAMLTGVRGSGKTVMLTNVENELRRDPSWIIVDANPELDILKMVAAELSNHTQLLQLFRDAKINLSFLGLGIEIDGVPPITDTVVALDRMLATTTHSGKKVLIAMDEVSSTPEVRVFVQQFQIFMRRKYSIYTLMAGLYENISGLQNEKTLTFLYRAPKFAMEPLNLTLIAQRYQKIFAVDETEARRMAKVTEGYPYAFQLLGYLCYNRKSSYLDVMGEFDAYLEEFVYAKTWSELSMRDQLVLRGMCAAQDRKVGTIRKVVGMNSSEFSVYRDRLFKKGIISAPCYGQVDFALPRFREFVMRKVGEDE